VKTRVYLESLGCRLNEAELEDWARRFARRGWRVTTDPRAADLVVVNTCAVTTTAARKSRQLIRRTHRHNPAARLVVSGCYASLGSDEAAAIDGVDMVVGNADKDRLVEMVHAHMRLPVMPQMAAEPGAAALFARGRSRAFVKIQDGCRYRCTFCVVTTARGEERSRPVAGIIDDVNSLCEQGVQEVVLTGVHVGGFGGDTGSSLYALIRSILAETGLPRLRLASVEPWDLPDNFFSLFDNPRLMPHMHLPLQSGTDTVLRRMARRCKTGDYAQLVQQAREQVPGFGLTTDVIVGFPGESDAEWRAGLDFIEQTGFSHIHIFNYSARPGTKAAGLPGQVDPAVRRQRSRELHQLAARLRHQALQEQVGRTADVLWEKLDGAQTCNGYTPNYLRVQRRAGDDAGCANTVERVLLTGLGRDGDRLSGVPAAGPDS